MTRGIHFASRKTDVPPARITIARREREPALWEAYLRGADARYADFGLEGVTEDHTDAGQRSDTWFTLAWLDGKIAGGMRMHAATRLPLLDELSGHVNEHYLASVIRGRQADGVVHCGGLWVNKAFRRYPNLTADLARSHLVLVQLVGARWSVGTSAEHTLGAWSSLGYREDPSIRPFPYPDERYRTRVLWCDMRSEEAFDPGLRSWMISEADRISSGSLTQATITPRRSP